MMYPSALHAFFYLMTSLLYIGSGARLEVLAIVKDHVIHSIFHGVFHGAIHGSFNGVVHKYPFCALLTRNLVMLCPTMAESHTSATCAMITSRKSHRSRRRIIVLQIAMMMEPLSAPSSDFFNFSFVV